MPSIKERLRMLSAYVDGLRPEVTTFLVAGGGEFHTPLTPEEYLRGKGQDYRNTPFLQVYGHEGEPCPVCGETLCRKIIGGRSSTYCPSCQGQR